MSPVSSLVAPNVISVTKGQGTSFGKVSNPSSAHSLTDVKKSVSATLIMSLRKDMEGLGQETGLRHASNLKLEAR
jgi:hypothetical protein